MFTGVGLQRWCWRGAGSGKGGGVWVEDQLRGALILLPNHVSSSSHHLDVPACLPPRLCSCPTTTSARPRSSSPLPRSPSTSPPPALRPPVSSTAHGTAQHSTCCRPVPPWQAGAARLAWPICTWLCCLWQYLVQPLSTQLSGQGMLQAAAGKAECCCASCLRCLPPAAAVLEHLGHSPAPLRQAPKFFVPERRRVNTGNHIIAAACCACCCFQAPPT